MEGAATILQICIFGTLKFSKKNEKASLFILECEPAYSLQ